MKKIISLALASLLAISMLAGCSQTPADNTADTENTDSASSVSSSGNTADESEDSANTMTFYNGEMELPTEFDNFAVIDYSLFDQFVSLGATPSYSALPNEDLTSRSYVDYTRIFEDYDLSGVTDLDTSSETYFEELLALAPDFIVIPDGSERDLGKYEAIAPTYVFPTITEAPEGSYLWKEELRYVAEFLGKVDMGEELISTYDQLVVDSRALVADQIEGKTALVVQLNEKGFKLRMPEDQTAVYSDIGFLIPEGLNADYQSTSFSSEDGSFPVEVIVEFNPDYILIHNQGVDNYMALVGTPIWENISAVADGRVYETNQLGWNHYNGYSANTHRINELVYFITEDKQSMPELLSIIDK